MKVLKPLLVLVLSTSFLFANTNTNQHEHDPAPGGSGFACDDPIANYRPEYLSLATGDNAHFKRARNYPWPFHPKSIGHNIASYQQYGWSQAYFHHGIDIRGDEGLAVHASVGGQVVNVANYNGGSRYYWEVAILDDEGFLWQYHHINHETIPENVKQAFKDKGRVEAGTFIGDIVDWPASAAGEVYTHVHLNVLGKDGLILNPLNFLKPIGDDQEPEIVKIGLLNSSKRLVKGNETGPDYSLFVHARDLISHHAFYVPPYKIEFRLDGGEWQEHWKFDGLPGVDDLKKDVQKFYVKSEVCGNYRCRKIFMDLGYTVDGDRSFPKTKGEHTVDVRISDLAGNSSQDSFSYQVH